jgi:hypothetical protein
VGFEMAVAIGKEADKQIGVECIAIGPRAFAGGFRAIAFGVDAQANGDFSIAIGSRAFADGKGAVAIGDDVYAKGDNVVVIKDGEKFNEKDLKELLKLMRRFFSDHENRVKELRSALIEQDMFFERLDKAMASPETIAQHTKDVGGFVSSLNLTETAEQIVDRAIEKLKQLQIPTSNNIERRCRAGHTYITSEDEPGLCWCGERSSLEVVEDTKKEEITVIDIVRQYLENNKYDGLCNPGLCACLVEDLAPCGEINGDCQAGYRTECKDDEDCPLDGDCDFHIGSKK